MLIKVSLIKRKVYFFIFIAALNSFMESLKEGLQENLKGLHHRCFVRKLPNISRAANENSNSFFKIFQCRCRCHANVNADTEMPMRRFPDGLFISVKKFFEHLIYELICDGEKKVALIFMITFSRLCLQVCLSLICAKKVRYVKGFLQANK